MCFHGNSKVHQADKEKKNHCSYPYAVICPLQKQPFMAQKSTVSESDMTAQAYVTRTQAVDTGL